MENQLQKIIDKGIPHAVVIAYHSLNIFNKQKIKEYWIVISKTDRHKASDSFVRSMDNRQFYQLTMNQAAKNYFNTMQHLYNVVLKNDEGVVFEQKCLSFKQYANNL